MRIIDFKKEFQTALNELYPKTEITSFFELLLETKFSITRLDYALHPEKLLTQKQVEELRAVCERLKKSEPIQYILGETDFCGLKFKVDKRVLIPRPETEELIDWIVKDTLVSETEKEVLNLLDIGTGSGCIAIALAKRLPQANVFAVDVSIDALQLAEENAQQNGAEVCFKQLDILHPEDQGKKFSTIVSNPPYVRQLEKKQMRANVLNYEPHLALFVADEDALLFYRKILDFAHGHLEEGGSIYFEINEFLATDLQSLFRQYGYKDFTFKKDIFGKTRMARLRASAKTKRETKIK